MEVDDEKHTEGTVDITGAGKHSHEFWLDISERCRHDPDSLKEMVASKKISLADCDERGLTLLLYAAHWGAYDLVRFCINMGADIEHKNNDGKQALDLAREGAWFHVEQLLLFAAMDSSVGEALRSTADTINRQKGVTEIFANELRSEYQDKQVQQLVQDALTSVMHKVIENKLAFSDDLLNLCLHFECAEQNVESILKTTLWQTIAATSKNVIESGNKRDWFWFKEFLLKSSIWHQRAGQSNAEPSYLYYELLNMIETQSQQQLNKLQADIIELAQKQDSAWQDLKAWKLPAIDARGRVDVAVRQDTVLNGVAAKYSHKELSEHGSSSSFNAHTFYDHHDYLPQLVLLANQLDDEFHDSVQSVFGIDHKTKTARLADTKGDGVVRYTRGPVKLMERARAKAESDYFKQAFPTSACVLDFNRCAFIFDDIETLLNALALFVRKVQRKEAGNIIGIVRYKNTFTQFSESPDYADIKLNCVIRGKSNNLVAEVQFLLRAMKTFKDRAHNLYSVQRQKEYFDNSVTRVLPILLNEKRQLFVAGNMGDVKTLCKLLVHQNKSPDFLVQIDEESGESILHNMCVFDSVRAVQFLWAVVPQPMFIGRLFVRNRYNQDPVSALVEYLPWASGETINFLFSIDSVRQRCVQDMNTKYRVLWWLFASAMDVSTIEYVTSDLLCLSQQELVEVIQHRYVEDEPKKALGARDYTEHIVTAACYNENINSGVLANLESLLGVDQLLQPLLVNNASNMNAVECVMCISNSNAMMPMKYLLSIEKVKEMYAFQRKENHDRIFRLLYAVICRNGDDDVMDFVLDALKLNSKEVLTYFIKYRCLGRPSPQELNRFASNKWLKYHNYLLLAQIVTYSTVDRLMKVLALVDENVFSAMLLQSDGSNVNALEYAIYNNNVDAISFILEIDAVKKECVRNKDVLWRVVFWLDKVGEPDIMKTVASLFNAADRESMQDLHLYKVVKPENMTGLDAGAFQYWNKSISSAAVAKLLLFSCSI